MKGTKEADSTETRGQETMGKVIPIKTQEVFTFRTKEKFLEALEFTRQVIREEAEKNNTNPTH